VTTTFLTTNDGTSNTSSNGQWSIHNPLSTQKASLCSTTTTATTIPNLGFHHNRSVICPEINFFEGKNVEVQGVENHSRTILTDFKKRKKGTTTNSGPIN